jgi:hypothetical protein
MRASRRLAASASVKSSLHSTFSEAGATIAADNGATEYELMAIFGWETAKEAARYTRNANRKKLASEALRLIAPAEPVQKGNEIVPPSSDRIVPPVTKGGKI